LNALAQVPGLKVAARTSAFAFKGKDEDLREVGRVLGVATVLEGSVQKAEGKVRIDVQLIDARNDSHLWAQNYDRDLKDVFAVQSDVAEKVADALKAQLLPAESARIASVPTQNQQAYDLFLKAEYFTNQIEATSAKDPTEALRKAADLYERAIAADPDFALAYARLSYLKAGAYWQGTDPSPQAIAAAQSAATKALTLQPNLPEAHLAMGYVHYWGHRDYAEALREFAIARASLPNDANVIAAIAYVHRRQGKLMQCIAELQQAAIIAPRNPLLPISIGTSYVALRRYTDADAAFQRALVILPDSVVTLVSRAAALMMGGDTPAAARVLAAIPAADDPQGTASLARFDLAMAMRQPDAALAAIANAPAWLLGNTSHELIPVTLLRGQALARKGDSTAARAAFLDAQQMLAGRSGGSQDQADTQSDLADVYAGLGHKEAALKAARRAAELLPMSQDMLAGPFYLARLAKIEAQVGETDSALDHVRQLLATPAGAEVSAASLRTDPAWDPLRKDPRFQKLIADAEAAQAKVKP
jgi:tetratricopeptide (TPR) repeat protein